MDEIEIEYLLGDRGLRAACVSGVQPQQRADSELPLGQDSLGSPRRRDYHSIGLGRPEECLGMPNLSVPELLYGESHFLRVPDLLRGPDGRFVSPAVDTGGRTGVHNVVYKL